MPRLAAFAALILPLTSLAQAPAAPNEEVTRARAAVLAMGKTWSPEVLAETAKVYTELQRQRSSAGIRQISDVSYGSHRQQKLDLFVPDQGFDDLGPVIIFLHGGAETGGDKILAGSDGLLYGNVAKALARAGGIGINANYRFGAGGSSGAEDVRLLVEWARRNSAQYGGDPQAIIVLGHGEGAALLASYLFHQPSQPEDGPGIAGAILSSGTFGASSRPMKLIEAYRGKPVPLLLWSAELDPVESGMEALKDALCRKYGSCPMYALLAGHNHVSQVMSFDSADTSAMGSLIRFYHSAVHK